MSDRIVALVDMDCFYCQVETRLNPSLKGVPMAVVQYNQWKGGGIIAVNYEARDRGVTRHMRGDEARKHCPEIQLVSVPAVRGKADLTKYRDAGREVVKVICEFSEVVQRASVDEAYIDLTAAVARRLTRGAKVTAAQLENTFVVGYPPDDGNDEEERSAGVMTWLEEVYGSCDLTDQALHRLATATALVEEMRTAIYDKTGFRCSAGIAHNKILAKLVAGLHKPNRQTVLPPAAVPLLYSRLPLKKVRNLGGKLGDDVVERLGITYMSELAALSEKQLQSKYDEKTGTWLYNIARGVDLEPVTPRLVSKSIGCCKKFPGVTSLRTRTDVTHWLSELAAEVAERLDEDINMNKRKAQLLTIHFSQEIDGRDVSMTRSVPFPGYEAEKIAACAFSVLSKLNSANPASDAWHPPLKYLGLSAGKFTEYSGNSIGSIDKFFKAKPSTSKSNDAEIPPEELVPVRAKGDGKIDNSLKNNISDLSNIREVCGKVSFFEKYFMNQPNKIIKNSPVKDNTSRKDEGAISEEISEKSTDDAILCGDSPDHNKLDKQIEEVPQPSTKEAKLSINNEENWISPSEIFPDLEDIDDSVMDILPSPLQRKISELKETKKRCSGGDSRLSNESDCAPTRVETVVDIHSSKGRDNKASTSAKCVVQVKTQEGRPEDEDAIESLFDQSSPDLFASENKEEEEQTVGSASEGLQTSGKVSEECSYCRKLISIYELQEHIDHHVALELQEQWNKQPQNVRTVTKETKTNKSVTVIGEKKKRGRPSKKDIVAPKKLRTIVSFFTKS